MIPGQTKIEGYLWCTEWRSQSSAFCTSLTQNMLLWSYCLYSRLRLGVLLIPHQYLYPTERAHKLPFSYNSL